MNNHLPAVSLFKPASFIRQVDLGLVIAEGFEDRACGWLRSLPDSETFTKVVLLKNSPERKSRLHDLLAELHRRKCLDIDIVEFQRYDPSASEPALFESLSGLTSSCSSLIIDISVMSKLMILFLINALRNYSGPVRIIYTEPVTYSPSEEEYNQHISLSPSFAEHASFPSHGVHNIEHMSSLSSSIMQDASNVAIAFTSFNENLIRALLSNIHGPNRFFLINGVPPSLSWREKATMELHWKIYEDYASDNIVSEAPKEVVYKCSTLYYSECFHILADFYRVYCYSHRIVLAPSGSKMQALACGLFKSCCQDVHIEYPTPESFYVEGLSVGVGPTHQVLFADLKQAIMDISEYFGLNG
jgi:hypothetical protein